MPFLIRVLLSSVFLAMVVLPTTAQDEPSSDDEQRVTTRVTAVTVYQRGAQVTREAEVTLAPGRTTLVFGNLTPALNPSSIQLSGTGAFTLLSVSHRTNYLEAASGEESVEALRARKTALEDSLDYVKMLREVYQQEEALLSENKTLGGQDGVDVEELKAAATYFRERLTDLKTQKLDVRRAEQDLRREIRRLDQQIREQQGGRRGSPVGEVVVAVSADRSTEGTFTLQYLTEKAGWTASYNARVEDVDAPLQLSMKANVRQATNVDWIDVRLTLSTGTPTRASTLPDLEPWRLAFPRAARWRGQARVITGAPASNPRVVAGRVTDARTGEPIPGANLVIEGTQVGTTTDAEGNYRLRVPGEAETLRATFVGYNSLSTPITSERIDFVLKASNAKLDEVVVRSSSRDASQGQRSASDRLQAALPGIRQTTSITTTEYVIDVPYTVPSDGKPHTVVVKEEEWPATYLYLTTPKVQQAAFLVARLTDWNRQALIKGPVSLFLGSTYVGRSTLDPASVEDTLTLSLGRDDGIVVRRVHERDRTERTFLGSKRKVTNGYRIEVRNTKAVPVDVLVIDQAPVSTDERIGVSVDIADRAMRDAETGELGWRITVPPSTTETMRFSYTVTYPRDRQLTLD